LIWCRLTWRRLTWRSLPRCRRRRLLLSALIRRFVRCWRNSGGLSGRPRASGRTARGSRSRWGSVCSGRLLRRSCRGWSSRSRSSGSRSTGGRPGTRARRRRRLR
jgi:hypothetical protein